MAKTWECENCGWTCPANPAITVEEAECDNCGGEMQAAAPDLPSPAWNRFAATAEAVRQGRAGDD